MNQMFLHLLSSLPLPLLLVTLFSTTSLLLLTCTSKKKKKTPAAKAKKAPMKENGMKMKQPETATMTNETHDAGMKTDTAMMYGAGGAGGNPVNRGPLSKGKMQPPQHNLPEPDYPLLARSRSTIVVTMDASKSISQPEEASHMEPMPKSLNSITREAEKKSSTKTAAPLKELANVIPPEALYTEESTEGVDDEDTLATQAPTTKPAVTALDDKKTAVSLAQTEKQQKRNDTSRLATANSQRGNLSPKSERGRQSSRKLKMEEVSKVTTATKIGQKSESDLAASSPELSTAGSTLYINP